MAEAKTDIKKTKKTSFFKGVKQEWRKIIWTPKHDLVKQTSLVVVISVMMGIIISVVDSGVLRLIEMILGL